MKPAPAEARLAPDGFAELENDRLLVRLDPRRAGSAWSFIDKASGLDLALCQGYGARLHPALFEILEGQPVSEGRVDAIPLPYSLQETGVDGSGAAFARFSGYPAGEKKGIRLDKTCQLAPGSARLAVELVFVNETAAAVPHAAWISCGVRIPEQDAAVFSPAPDGTLRTAAPWHQPASVMVNVPRAAAGWTAAVSGAEPHAGLCLAAADRDVDAVWNWLGKFPGFTLGFGTPQRPLPPGESRRLAYSLGLLRGLPRIDAATGPLAGGLSWDETGTGTSRRVTVRLLADEPLDAAVTLASRGLSTGGRTAARPVRLRLEPGRPAEAAFDLALPGDDTHILTARVRTRHGVLRLERPLVIGLPRALYRRVLPRLDGTRLWGPRIGERPLQPRTQQCDRTVKHPLVPWLAPPAGRPLKVLFLGEVSFNLAVFRDLARRGGFTWDFVQLWGTGDMRTGPYGRAEVERARRKLRRLKPDCVLTAGLRYADAPRDLIEALWSYAQGGGGLVLVGRDDPHWQGVWPGRLAAEALPETADPAGSLRSLFTAGIAPLPEGRLRAFRAGKGRVLLLDKDLDWPVLGPWGNAAPRNDLLPRYRGTTELPDWEYHFAQYLLLIRHAAGAAPSSSILGVDLEADALTVRYRSDAGGAACLACDILGTDRLRILHLRRDVLLQAGDGTVRLPLPALPSNAYVAHAWLLDGHAGLDGVDEGTEKSLLREGHPRPVLDFTAVFKDLNGSLRIRSIDVVDSRDGTGVPGNVTVAVEGAPADLAGAEIELEWRNGPFDRVVWRRREPLAGRRKIVFSDIAFAPVSPEGASAVRLWLDGRVAAEKARPVRAWKPGDTAERELAFLTAAGGEHDWYGTRMMKPWAEEEAGFDFTFLRYGLEGQGFPWRREAGQRLVPPIVDERPLREDLAAGLRKAYEAKGDAYICMCDEFRLGGEYDWSPPTLAAWRRWLEERYGGIARLNAQWGTSLKDFEEAAPCLLAEARREPDNPSRWVDFRLFMDARINRRFEVAEEEAALISPRLKVGDSGAYAPAPDVGINFFTMIRASRFTMTYGGLRSEWVRSFRREDDTVGVWYGYGWANPLQPWEALFRRYDILAWWGYLLHKRLTARGNMSLIHLDLTPAEPFREIGRQQAEIRSGLGRLIRHGRAAPPHAWLPYSQASVYAGAVTGESHEEGAGAALGLLQGTGLAGRFLADEEAAGRLAGGAEGRPLILLANTDALPDETAAAYAAAAGAGAFVLADAAAGSRDGHGRRCVKSELDTTFGVDRSKARFQEATRFEPVAWSPEAPPELGRGGGLMVRAATGLRVTDGAVWGRFTDGEPAVVAQRTAAGSLVLLLNTRLPWASSNKVAKALNPEDRPDELAPDATVGRLFDLLAKAAGAAPYAQVGSETVRAKRIFRFDDGRCRCYALLTDRAAGVMTVTLQEDGHTYDARKGRYLGFGRRFDVAVKKTDLARVFTQLPYRVNGLKAAVDGDWRPGGTVRIRGWIVAADGLAADAFHVVHAELMDPAGRRPLWRRINLDAGSGRFEHAFPLALNDPPGEWRLILRDAATGVKRRLIVKVRPA